MLGTKPLGRHGTFCTVDGAFFKSLNRFGKERLKARRVVAVSPASRGRRMERALAYAISAGIVGFGIWLLVSGLSSGAPILWACASLPPIAIGLLSAFGDC
jgi:hypothetical protein